MLLCAFLVFLVGLLAIELFAGGMRGRCFHDDASLARYGEPFDATVASGLQNPTGKPILCNPGLEGFGKLFELSQPCPPSQSCSVYSNPLCEGDPGGESYPEVCEYNANPDPSFNLDSLGRAMLTIVRTLMLDDWAQTMKFLQVCVFVVCVRACVREFLGDREDDACACVYAHAG